MSFSVVVSDLGRLSLEASSADPTEAEVVLSVAEEKALKVGFARGREAGLLCLAGELLEAELPEGLLWWRELSVGCVERFCRLLGEGAPEWEEAVWEGWLERCPPMEGRERLSLSVVEKLWADLSARLIRLAGEEPAEYLRKLHPFWSDLGRVMFHVAENKASQEKPFAFLATYARGFTKKGASQKKTNEISHQPLGKALQEYAEDTAGLKRLLVPVRRACEQSPVIAAMFESRQIFQAQAWTAQEAYAFLSETMQLRNCGVALRLPDWWKKKGNRRPQVVVSLEGEGEEEKSQVGMNAMFRFSVEVALGGEPLTEAEWAELLEGDDNLVRLKGQWVEVDRRRLREVLTHWQKVEAAQNSGVGEVTFAEGMRWLAGFGKGAQGGGLAEGLSEEDHEWFKLEASEALQAELARLRESLNDEADNEAGKLIQAELRPYQAEGVNWLRTLGGLGLGACLADDMGLGKTIQTIAYLAWRHLSDQRPESRNQNPDLECELRSGGEVKSSLLIVPASLLGNWKSELERFCPELDFYIAHRSQSTEGSVRHFFAQPVDFLGEQEPHLVLTTYQLATREKSLRKVEWNTIILDEAQAIKNPSTEQTRAVKSLQAQVRIALTGTPVENRLGDLWSLFDFINPGLLGNSTEFAEALKLMRYRGGKEGIDYSPLRELTSPYIKRRLKTDPGVAPDLPEKTELKVLTTLSKEQAKIYRSGVEELANAMREAHASGQAEAMQRNGLVLTYLMRFKQVCNHPALWLGDADYDEARSGKFQRLRELAEVIAKQREKVLVFTQFREMCQPLATALEAVFGKKGLVLHGGTKVEERQKLVEAFNDPAGAPFFVLSLKAGGTGLNLTAANHVIHFDRWWNPAVENQATDRAFRIGQKRNVLVHKFVCQGTIEEKIDGLIFEKLQLAGELLSDENENLGSLIQLGDEKLLELFTLDLEKAVL